MTENNKSVGNGTLGWKIARGAGLLAAVQAGAATIHLFVIYWGWQLLIDFWDTPVEGIVMGQWIEVGMGLLSQWILWAKYLPFLHHDALSFAGVLAAYAAAAVIVHLLNNRSVKKAVQRTV